MRHAVDQTVQRQADRRAAPGKWRCKGGAAGVVMRVAGMVVVGVVTVVVASLRALVPTVPRRRARRDDGSERTAPERT